ncbi:MAG: hypothetical protein ACW99F_13470 [Candidatus Hodarchaeales archaeon]
MRSEDIVGVLEKKYLTNVLEKGSRVDGRDYWERRPIQVIPNVINKAEGSAMV